MSENFAIQPSGERLGPFDVDTLKSMSAAGKITPETMIQDVKTGQAVPAVALPHLSPGPSSPQDKLPAWAVKRISVISKVGWAGIVCLILWIADVRHFLITSRPAPGLPAQIDAFLTTHPIVLLAPGLIFLFVAWLMMMGVRERLRAERMAAPTDAS